MDKFDAAAKAKELCVHEYMNSDGSCDEEVKIAEALLEAFSHGKKIGRKDGLLEASEIIKICGSACVQRHRKEIEPKAKEVE